MRGIVTSSAQMAKQHFAQFKGLCDGLNSEYQLSILGELEGKAPNDHILFFGLQQQDWQIPLRKATSLFPERYGASKGE